MIYFKDTIGASNFVAIPTSEFKNFLTKFDSIDNIEEAKTRISNGKNVFFWKSPYDENFLDRVSLYWNPTRKSANAAIADDIAALERNG